MAVYVDDMKAAFGGMVMCHMLADSTEELLAMADRIGVRRRWIQHAGRHDEHFDIAQTKRRQAVAAGALEITLRQAGAMMYVRRLTGALPAPDAAVTRMQELMASTRAAKCGDAPPSAEPVALTVPSR